MRGSVFFSQKLKKQHKRVDAINEAIGKGKIEHIAAVFLVEKLNGEEQNHKLMKDGRVVAYLNKAMKKLTSPTSSLRQEYYIDGPIVYRHEPCESVL